VKPHRIWILVLLAGLLGGRAATAGPPFGGGEPHIAELLERDAEAIGLDEPTLARLREIVAAARGEEERIHGEIRAARRGLRDLLSAEQPEEAAVMRQAELLGALETEALKHRLRTLLAVRPLLTDEQFARLRELRHGRRAVVVDACRADVARFCAAEEEAIPGRGLLRCLRRHAAELSPACRAALEEARGPYHQ
jgi:Spy/CpxP family protein refolding chaperone